MYFAVTNVIPLLYYQLHLTFNNGEEKIFDMKPHLTKGIFQELKDTKIRSLPADFLYLLIKIL